MDFQNTDLALEVQEQFEENQVEVPGVVLRKKRSADGKVLTTFVEILDKEGEKGYGEAGGDLCDDGIQERNPKGKCVKRGGVPGVKEEFGKQKDSIGSRWQG
ncbi:MAG: hypothetical protein ACLSG9_10560 [Eubacterium sp.]